MNSISLIVCIRNEERALPHLLKSLNPLPNDEIVFVLDRCSDNSKNIIESYDLKCIKKIIEIEETNWPNAPKKYAVLQGVLNSSNKLLLFTDADCKLSQNHFEVNRVLFQKHDIIIGFCIPEKVPSTFLEKIQFVHFMWTASLFSLFTKMKLPYMVMGANWGYHKNLFKQELLQQHSDIKSGDDDLFFQSLLAENPNIALNEITNVSTGYCENWKALIRQKLRHLKAGVKYKLKFKIMLGLISVFELFLLALIIVSGIIHQFQVSLYSLVILIIYYNIVFNFTMAFLKRNKLNHLSRVSLITIKPIHTLFIAILSLFSVFTNPKWKS